MLVYSITKLKSEAEDTLKKVKNQTLRKSDFGYTFALKTSHKILYLIREIKFLEEALKKC